MTNPKRSRPKQPETTDSPEAYASLAGDIATLLEEARRQAARSVNAILTATYWEIGRRIVQFEQKGERRAVYGEELLERLSQELAARCGRGFGVINLRRMRALFLTHPIPQIRSTVSIESAPALVPGEQAREPSSSSIGEYLARLAQAFPLSWSHYSRLLSVKSDAARDFYEAEALRGGWSVRQLDRQISTLFYERTALSKNKAAMLTKGATSKPEDLVTIEEQIKDPYVLGNLQNTIRAAEYRLALPAPEELEAVIARTRRMLEAPSRRCGSTES